MRSSRLFASLTVLMLSACGVKPAAQLAGQAAEVHGTWTCSASIKNPDNSIADVVGTVSYFSDGKWSSTHTEKTTIQGHRYEAVFGSRGVWEIRGKNIWEKTTFSAANSATRDGETFDHGALNQGIANSQGSDPRKKESLSTLNGLTARRMVSTDEDGVKATCTRRDV